MSIFSTILEKLGLKKPAEKPAFKPTASVGAPKPYVSTTPPRQTVDTNYRDSRPVPRAAGSAGVGPVPTPAPMAMVDVVSKLEKMAKDSGQKLDWKVSIVDLLKLLHMESSLAARKELAVELGCPPEKMKESQNMNIWLHKTVLQKLAENGGNIPKELLD